MTSYQLDIYKHVLNKTARNLCESRSSGLDEAVKTRVSNNETIPPDLRFILGHPYLIHDRNANVKEDNLINDCAKLKALDQIVEQLLPANSRTVVFAHHKAVLDLLEDYSDMKKIKYFRLDGSTKYEDQNEMVQKFNLPNATEFFIVSTRAGGLGKRFFFLFIFSHITY